MGYFICLWNIYISGYFVITDSVIPGVYCTVLLLLSFVFICLLLIIFEDIWIINALLLSNVSAVLQATCSRLSLLRTWMRQLSVRE